MSSATMLKFKFLLMSWSPYKYVCNAQRCCGTYCRPWASIKCF